MIPHLFYYQLVVWGLLWLCIMLHSPWPSRCATAQQGVADLVPLTFKRTRSNAPTPFFSVSPLVLPAPGRAVGAG